MISQITTIVKPMNTCCYDKKNVVNSYVNHKMRPITCGITSHQRIQSNPIKISLWNNLPFLLYFRTKTILFSQYILFSEILSSNFIGNHVYLMDCNVSHSLV